MLLFYTDTLFLNSLTINRGRVESGSKSIVYDLYSRLFVSEETGFLCISSWNINQ